MERISGNLLDQDFETLLSYLKRSRGFDFTGYKRASLMRRVEKRMQFVGIETFPDYVDYLEVHPDEFAHLFNAILINVTSFFRDNLAWETIAEEVIPRILQARETNEPIRVWSAGCASGEEAYTLAILFAEALGIDAYRERVKIYATDMDDEALAQARAATHTTRAVAGVPPALLEKYFEFNGMQYTFHKDLRRAVIFGRHDLLNDAPISRVDLLTCRNTMMYFNAETQTRLLTRFHFALNEDGCLFLGKAEMLFTHTNLFVPLNLKRRIFTKVARGVARERLISAVSNGSNEALQPNGGLLRIREQAFDAGAVAQIVVEMDGSLALANERARQMFGLGPRDMGRVLQDLEISYRPVELRSRIDQVHTERRLVEVKEVLWSGPSSTEQLYLDIQLIPLLESRGALLGVSITFTDITRYKRLQQQLEESNRELETAYEELQSTNEELETTNEELQSTVEELETTNEELQSTNEELETMNEELQSTNEELQTINEELQTRSAELNSVNAFLGAILGSLHGGVIVMDRDMQIQVWNQKSEDLWGLRLDEVRGKHLLNLDMGLPTEDLKGPIRTCLITGETQSNILLDATNRRGRVIHCAITCTALLSQSSEVLGAILLVEES